MKTENCSRNLCGLNNTKQQTTTKQYPLPPNQHTPAANSTTSTTNDHQAHQHTVTISFTANPYTTVVSGVSDRFLKILGIASGVILVLITMSFGFLIGDSIGSVPAQVGFYGVLVVWILIFKFKNELPILRSTLTWLFPYRSNK
jgi:hypothetical protein